METLNKGELITLENDIDYYVVEIIEQEGDRYLYLVNDERAEVVIGKEIIDGDNIIVETIDDREKMREITKLVLEKVE
ncbi:MAG: hypothetical protein ACOXZR_02030 [Bacilli bacterium]|jgi:hypothetical protein